MQRGFWLLSPFGEYRSPPKKGETQAWDDKCFQMPPVTFLKLLHLYAFFPRLFFSSLSSFPSGTGKKCASLPLGHVMPLKSLLPHPHSSTQWIQIKFNSAFLPNKSKVCKVPNCINDSTIFFILMRIFFN